MKLATGDSCWMLLTKFWPHRLKTSPTSSTCHQHILSPRPVTIIDLGGQANTAAPDENILIPRFVLQIFIKCEFSITHTVWVILKYVNFHLWSRIIFFQSANIWSVLVLPFSDLKIHEKNHTKVIRIWRVFRVSNGYKNWKSFNSPVYGTFTGSQFEMRNCHKNVKLI